MHNQRSVLRLMRMINLLENQPMTINHLSSLINTSQRTIYRYIDLLEELSYSVEKNNRNQYYINQVNLKTPTSIFTPEEAVYLKKLLLSSGKDMVLNDSILRKIELRSVENVKNNFSLKERLGKIVSVISDAIHSRHQIELINYHSFNSETISNRIIEPIGFTDNYDSLIAFEVASQKSKVFRVERIENVKLLNEKFRFKSEHKKYKVDAFGFAPNEKSTTIKARLKMSLKAYLLMKEEFPKTVNHITKVKGENQYILDIKVNSKKPIERFCEGMKNEISLLEN